MSAQAIKDLVDATRQAMSDAVDKNDFLKFSSTFLAFMTHFSAFNKAYSAGPTDVKAFSAIFGHRLFNLKQTNDAQAKQLLATSRTASKAFGTLLLEERLEFLKILEEKLDDYKEAIELVITADTGKPWELCATEMNKGKEWFNYAYEEAPKQIGVSGKPEHAIAPRPMGAAQIIGAYNYPYALTIGGIIGSLVAGNGVIISAPLKAPNWVFPFMQAAREALEEFAGKAVSKGKPWAESFSAVAEGLIQCSVGVNGNLTANADLVHFVGGDVTGRKYIAAPRGVKRTILEMGGSNVAVVMGSAVDYVGSAEEIAQTLYNGFGPATGQRCTAPRILCVDENAEDVVTALGAICQSGDHHIGNPFKDGIKMGPLVDLGAHQKMEEAIALAGDLGAKVYGMLKVDGSVIPQAADGTSFWINPIVIDWSPVDMSVPENAERLNAVLADEIFGPLLHVVHRVSSVEEAIEVTNRLDTHGLAGAIFTGDEEEMRKYVSGVTVTSLTVNEVPKDRSPWGPHGHPGLDTIGGERHFMLYCSEGVVAQPALKPQVHAPGDA